MLFVVFTFTGCPWMDDGARAKLGDKPLVAIAGDSTRSHGACLSRLLVAILGDTSRWHWGSQLGEGDIRAGVQVGMLTLEHSDSSKTDGSDDARDRLSGASVSQDSLPPMSSALDDDKESENWCVDQDSVTKSIKVSTFLVSLDDTPRVLTEEHGVPGGDASSRLESSVVDRESSSSWPKPKSSASSAERPRACISAIKASAFLSAGVSPTPAGVRSTGLEGAASLSASSARISENNALSGSIGIGGVEGRDPVSVSTHGFADSGDLLDSSRASSTGAPDGCTGRAGASAEQDPVPGAALSRNGFDSGDVLGA